MPLESYPLYRRELSPQWTEMEGDRQNQILFANKQYYTALENFSIFGFFKYWNINLFKTKLDQTNNNS